MTGKMPVLPKITGTAGAVGATPLLTGKRAQEHVTVITPPILSLNAGIRSQRFERTAESSEDGSSRLVRGLNVEY
jgi:hypothetical protein